MVPCGCILSKFYIKPQPLVLWLLVAWRCILSKFYIKPQQSPQGDSFWRVVSYRNSTSNHNTSILRLASIIVVSYRNSTSNHNPDVEASSSDLLYLIEILHQTTTRRGGNYGYFQLYLIEILHQTTTLSAVF